MTYTYTISHESNDASDHGFITAATFHVKNDKDELIAKISYKMYDVEEKPYGAVAVEAFHSFDPILVQAFALSALYTQMSSIDCESLADVFYNEEEDDYSDLIQFTM